jgi:hypothetical protein
MRLGVEILGTDSAGSTNQCFSPIEE